MLPAVVGTSRQTLMDSAPSFEAYLGNRGKGRNMWMVAVQAIQNMPSASKLSEITAASVPVLARQLSFSHAQFH